MDDSRTWIRARPGEKHAANQTKRGIVVDLGKEPEEGVWEQQVY